MKNSLKELETEQESFERQRKIQTFLGRDGPCVSDELTLTCNVYKNYVVAVVWCQLIFDRERHPSRGTAGLFCAAAREKFAPDRLTRKGRGVRISRVEGLKMPGSREGNTYFANAFKFQCSI